MCLCRFRPLLFILAGLLLLAGCSSLLLAPSRPDLPQIDVGVGDIQPVEGELASATGCTIHYRVYRPAEVPSSVQAPALVILGHGFLRSQQQMTGLAETIAAAGIAVATLDFCNMRFWDGRHQQNGLDMVALARHLATSAKAISASDSALESASNSASPPQTMNPLLQFNGGSVTDSGPAAKATAGLAGGAKEAFGGVIYAGFSAGALAALVAARNDPSALGVVTLDLVDAQGIGERAAQGLDKPLIGLVGEPTNCNANENSSAVFAAMHQAQQLRIAGAGHCDFEAPTDALCELVCTDPDQLDQKGTAQLRELILGQALSAIESLINGANSQWKTAAAPASG